LGWFGDDGENDRRKFLREEGDWSLDLTFTARDFEQKRICSLMLISYGLFENRKAITSSLGIEFHGLVTYMF
jgi:hypothetical protein